MIRKLVAIVVLVPLTALIVMFAVANRQIVTVTFDPFDSANPAAALTLPLFLLVFVLIGLGIVVGGAAAWLRQHGWRARARHAEAELRRLREQPGSRALSTSRIHPQSSPPAVLPPAA